MRAPASMPAQLHFEPAAAQAAEQRRAEALASYAILDTPPEREFDDLVRVAVEALRVPVALISLLDGERVWFKARLGLDAAELPRAALPFCAHAVSAGRTLVVPDARADPRFE